jgi:hypothetical protein
VDSIQRWRDDVMTAAADPVLAAAILAEAARALGHATLWNLGDDEREAVRADLLLTDQRLAEIRPRVIAADDLAVYDAELVSHAATMAAFEATALRVAALSERQRQREARSDPST